MKIAVTGASGFLGGRVVEHFLNHGHSAVSLLRPSSDDQFLQTLRGDHRITRGQLDDRAFLRQAFQGVDVVIHSAARVKEEGNRDQFIQENVALTEHVLEAAQQAGVRRFILISSPSVLAELKDQININESYPYPAQPLNHYCETKAIAERFVLDRNTPDFITCAIRPRCIWGPGDQSGPFKKLMGKLGTGKMLDVSGGKTVLSSMCYVTNATHACLLAAQSDSVGGKAYFITDGETVDTWAYLDVVADTFGLPKKKPVKHPALLKGIVKLIDLLWKIPYLEKNVPPPVSSYSIGLVTYSATFSTEAARRDFGYAPIVSLDSGMSEYVNWVEAQGGVSAYLAGN